MPLHRPPHRASRFSSLILAAFVVAFGCKPAETPQPGGAASAASAHGAGGDLAALPTAGANDAAVALAEEADRLAGGGRFAEAVEKLKLATASDPGDEETLFNLAFYESRLGRTNDAIGHYQAVIAISPKNVEAHNNLGNLHLKRNDLTQARSSFSEAIRLNAKQPSAHNNLGIVNAREGRLAEAIQQFEQATRLKPDYTEAWVNLGNALVGQGRLNEAIPPFEMALQIQPGLPTAVEGLRRVRLRLGGTP